MHPSRTLARRTFAGARIRTASFGLFSFGVTFAVTAGYRTTYPTLAGRLRLARAFGHDAVFRLFYGTPYRLDTVGGYASWRAAGVLSLFAAYFGAAAAASVLRGEEESGRFELVAAGAITRRSAFAARLAAVGAALGVLWLATTAGLVAGRLPVAGSAYLALSVVSAAAVYAGVGALMSQLAATRRGALELAGLVLAVDFAVRVVSDTADLQTLHWLTPLGWIEELRSFAGPQPLVLLLPLALTVLLCAASFAIERRRDVGGAVLAARDGHARPQLHLLGSSNGLALRCEQVSLAIWIGATAAYALVIGSTSKNVAAGLSSTVKEQLHRLGQLELATPEGYLGLSFLFFVLAISLFCCSKLAAARHEEAEGRLETVFALPQGRVGWLARRLMLAASGATILALVAAVGSALGADLVGSHVSLLRLLEAGLNCLPVSALFLGLGALLVAWRPRLGVGTSYALVSVAFVWQLFGALLGAPAWLLGVSPFDHIGFVPAQPFRLDGALVMVAIGTAGALAAGLVFRSRDLVSA